MQCNEDTQKTKRRETSLIQLQIFRPHSFKIHMILCVLVLECGNGFSRKFCDLVGVDKDFIFCGWKLFFLPWELFVDLKIEILILESDKLWHMDNLIEKDAWKEKSLQSSDVVEVERLYVVSVGGDIKDWSFSTSFHKSLSFHKDETN